LERVSGGVKQRFASIDVWNAAEQLQFRLFEVETYEFSLLREFLRPFYALLAVTID
jgi:hypothetical protein